MLLRDIKIRGINQLREFESKYYIKFRDAFRFDLTTNAYFSVC